MASQLPGMETKVNIPVAKSPIWWQSAHGQRWLGAASIVVITITSCWLALHPYWVLQMGNWGYLGAFVISLIASATIILPVPGLAKVHYADSAWC